MNGECHLILALGMAVSHSPLAVELDIGPGVIPFGLEATTCFIVLESIANVAKHARATNVKVKIWLEDTRVVTEIEDDGIGGATNLGKLKDRARAAGGTIEIDSPPGIGTLIRVEVPVADRDPTSAAQRGPATSGIAPPGWQPSMRSTRRSSRRSLGEDRA